MATTGPSPPIARLVRLSLIVIPAYLIAMYWPWSASFFRLAPFGIVQWFEVLAVAVPAYGLSLLSDRILFGASTRD